MKKISTLGVVFACVHLFGGVVWLIIDFDGEWLGFYLFIVDLPLSLLIMQFSGWLNMSREIAYFLLLVMGTCWWYMLGALIYYFYNRRHRR